MKRFAFIVLVGSVLTARCTWGTAGDLDASFGTNGLAVAGISAEFDVVRKLVIQPDGKIVAAGDAGAPLNNDYALARFNSDGTLDATFGVGGMVRTPMVTCCEQVSDVVAQPDGKLVVAGIGSLVRYDQNGTLDPTFGAGGVVFTSPIYAAALGITVQSDGKLVVAGRVSGSAEPGVVVRYHSDGSLDDTFATGGILTTTVAREIVLQPDGKIVVSGIRALGELYFLRCDADGVPDPTLGVNGETTLIVSRMRTLEAMLLQPDGKLVVAGTADHVNQFASDDFVLVRVLANGARDNSFGTGGTVRTSIAEFDTAYALVQQADGKLIAAGQANDFVQPGRPAITRYNSDGSLDSTFGNGGTLLAGAAPMDAARGLAIDADGRIVIGGTGSVLENNEFVVARLIGGVCGDGIAEAGEVCEDGNLVGCDGCSVHCTFQSAPVCGDSIYRPDCGEQCDDGNPSGGDGCSPLCKLDFIPGGGIKSTDCFAEWGVINPTNFPLIHRGRFNSTQTCHDNDPSCDFDPGLGQCVFHVTLCTGIVDVGLPLCIPTALASWEVQRPKVNVDPVAHEAFTTAGAALVAEGTSGCSPHISVSVPLRNSGGILRKGKLILRTRATTATGIPDKDTLKFVCLP